MSSRRSFLQKTTALGLGAFGTNSLFNQLQAKSFSIANANWDDDAPEGSGNEDYWSVVQQAYTVSPQLINLNNAGVSPAPRIVQEALNRYNAYCNEAPSYYMWRILDQGREPLRYKLAQLAGCSAEEIAVNRNTTEALSTVIYGLPLQRGDEVIGTLQDYPNMVQAWRQRQSREGIKYTQISFNFPIEDDDAIVAAFAKAITPATKVLHITHVINWVGQIMPVKKLCNLAHSKGIEVIVDGAHSFGLLDFKISDLGCDYFGTSLHKFLSAPIGSGMLYIKKEKIEKIWPLTCNSAPQSADIRKFETIGTRSFAIEQAIGEAINFHTAIGPKRKEDRIRFLKNYWAEKVKDIPKVVLHTSLKKEYSCAICGIHIEGMKIADLYAKLFDPYKIHTSPVEWENIHCVRITPHMYTTLADLDKLVEAVKAITASA